MSRFAVDSGHRSDATALSAQRTIVARRMGPWYQAKHGIQLPREETLTPPVRRLLRVSNASSNYAGLLLGVPEHASDHSMETAPFSKQRSTLVVCAMRSLSFRGYVLTTLSWPTSSRSEPRVLFPS
ncbi:Piso0_002358 [Millerozyma farinosa CBS 7064]|uniref:Piso0_002358 protein n=1 Tax=Pichia sorbitophila (strain ATCC MYA-4447 / BCRC 22081 / CBS 7064 / NBRC 10061 / NRRL Y-12695) TaxID=559304 RepID=G8YEU5_PICSO|nr:Piso0_002358 [Millerozyma farinosa CBS 7064]